MSEILFTDKERARYARHLILPQVGEEGQKKIISSSHGVRYFCQECGTPLVCVLDEDQENIYITICSLDKPEDFKPKGDIYVEDMLDWVKR